MSSALLPPGENQNRRGSSTPVKLFLVYSRKDSRVLDRLLRHFEGLETQGIIELLYDLRIPPGDTWKEILFQGISEADLAVPLITPNFLRSEFCLKEEMPRLLTRHRAGKVKLIPLLLEPCYWQMLDWLRDLQMFPVDGTPIFAAPAEKQEEILVDLTEKIFRLVQGTLQEPDPDPDPVSPMPAALRPPAKRGARPHMVLLTSPETRSRKGPKDLSFDEQPDIALPQSLESWNLPACLKIGIYEMDTYRAGFTPRLDLLRTLRGDKIRALLHLRGESTAGKVMDIAPAPGSILASQIPENVW